MKKEKNEVFLSGYVINMEKINDEESMVTVFSKHEFDRYLKFICKTALLKNIAENDYIMAKGIIYGGADKESSIRIFVKSINCLTTLLEEHFPDLKGTYSYPGKAVLFLSGTIVSAEKEDNGERFKISTNKILGEETTIYCFNPSIEQKHLKKEGDRVSIVADLSTPKDSIDDSERFFYDIEISAMA